VTTKKAKTKTAKAKKLTKRKGHRTVRRGFPRGVDLAIIYEGGLDRDRDRSIYAVLDPYSTGSGFSFDDGKRDICATVPDDDLARVVGALKEIPGVEIKKRVVEWVNL